MAHTALSWFFDNLKNHEIQAEHFELYQQAKEMEKEQIVDAATWGALAETGEQYYNEKYNK
jgi:hypothetical protein